MSFAAFRTDLKTIIDTISQIEGVSNTPKASFSGFPYVTIAPSNIDSELIASDLVKRSYSFNIFVFYDDEDYETAISEVADITDRIINALVADDKLGINRTIGDSLDFCREILNVTPINGEWGHLNNMIYSKTIVTIELIRDYYHKALATEDSDYLMTEAGDYIVTNG